MEPGWQELADYFEIEEYTRNQFSKGNEARGIWAWLESREKFNELYDALDYIDRKDLVAGMQRVADDVNLSVKQKLYTGNSSEIKRLLEKVDNSALNHQQRERIGVRLAEIGDTRPGVGVDANDLPQFDWLEVPSGRIELENNAGIYDVNRFYISRYPTTYRQYRCFLTAGDGYHNQQWWQSLIYEKNPGEQYRIIDNNPAETVSWFNAMAFCRWLTNKFDYPIRLPTEFEWEQAATWGNPENVYPWGGDFDAQRCNTIESGLGRTTAVGIFPNHEFPGRPLDMSGNVWEWCANAFDQPENPKVDIDVPRVVRGGSWYDHQSDARSACRMGIGPVCRRNSLGFRVVSSSPIMSE